MRVSVRRSPNHRALPLSIGLSALAFVGLAYVETVPAHAGQSLAVETVDVLPTPSHSVMVLADLDEEELADTSGAAVARATTTMAAAVAPTSMITVPNVVGMRLSAARRAMKDVGIKLVVRDSFNEKIERDEFRFFNVRRQSLEAGTEVEPGSWVRLQVRERNFVAMGY